MTTVTGFLRSLADRFSAWRERERAFAELNALDERALADLGLRRSDIPFVVYCKPRQGSATAEFGFRIAANSNDGMRAA
jgi:uncharacterized protein YjiS (DUF1127 family)